MDLSFLVVVLHLLVGGKDAVDLIDARTYWELHATPMTVEALRPHLTPPDLRRVNEQASQLGAADAGTRAAAVQALIAQGEVVQPTVVTLMMHPDPQVREGALAVLRALNDTRDGRPPVAWDLHRLMAIKALGALRDPAAAPDLQALTTSTEPFVAEYARYALLALQDERPPPIPRRESGLSHRVYALPADANLVAHISPIPGGEKQAPDTGRLRINVGGMNLTGDGDMRKQTPRLAEFLAWTGNFRAHGGLVGMHVTGPKLARSSLIATGEFDGERMLAAFALGAANAEWTAIDGQPGLVLPEGHAALVLAAPKTLVLVHSITDNYTATAADISRRLRGDPVAEPQGDLLEGVDRGGPVWGAATLPTEHWRGDWSLFRRFVTTSRATEGFCDFRIEAVGQTDRLDELKLDGETIVADLSREWKDGLGQLPIGKPITQLLESLHFSVNDENHLTLDGRMSPRFIAMLPIAAILISAPIDDEDPPTTTD